MIGRLLLCVATHQGVNLAQRFADARNKYDLAYTASRRRGKPFLIIGGPAGSVDSYDGTWISSFAKAKKWAGIRGHGCGDLCVDLDPNACEGCEYMKADITDLPFADKEFGAVLSSHVLEHMADADMCQAAWSELHRVADEVFVSLPNRQSIFAWLVTDHHLWVTEVGSGILDVEERNSGARYLVDPYRPPEMYYG